LKRLGEYWRCEFHRWRAPALGESAGVLPSMGGANPANDALTIRAPTEASGSILK